MELTQVTMLVSFCVWVADLKLLLINGTDPSHNAGFFLCLGCDSVDPMLLMMKESEIQGQVC
jgi:hypothetical protein